MTGGQSDIDRFSEALENREPGSLTYIGERGTLIRSPYERQ